MFACICSVLISAHVILLAFFSISVVIEGFPSSSLLLCLFWLSVANGWILLLFVCMCSGFISTPFYPLTFFSISIIIIALFPSCDTDFICLCVKFSFPPIIFFGAFFSIAVFSLSLGGLPLYFLS